MKYLKKFEELSPKVYKNAAKGIRSRDIEEYERITGRKASELQKLGAEKKAKELEDFAKEREKHWDEEKQIFNDLPSKKD